MFQIRLFLTILWFIYQAAGVNWCLHQLRRLKHHSHAVVMNIVLCSLHPTCHYHFFWALTGSWHQWWKPSFPPALWDWRSAQKSFWSWTCRLCRGFIRHRVALVFTGYCCSLWRDMSPHWKWSASILSAHSFLIRWFVSLGNWSQPQPRSLWKFKPATYPVLCEQFLMNKIYTGKDNNLVTQCEGTTGVGQNISPRMLKGPKMKIFIERLR